MSTHDSDERSLVTNNSSTASILMQASGQTFKVTGLTLSTSSTLYTMKYLTTAGCSLLEYLPHLFNSDDTVGFRQHMAEKNSLSWWAVGSAVLILGGGILIRKVGTTLSDPGTIRGMERFLYGRGKKE